MTIRFPLSSNSQPFRLFSVSYLNKKMHLKDADVVDKVMNNERIMGVERTSAYA
jgi:hypothetical protein